MVLRPHLYVSKPHGLLTWGPFSGFLGLCGVRQGYGCVGIGHCDDSSADSSASLAQCCSCGGFFPRFAISALLWGLLFFLRILAFIPRLHFWCCLFCSPCLFSSSLSPPVIILLCLAAGLHLCWSGCSFGVLPGAPSCLRLTFSIFSYASQHGGLPNFVSHRSGLVAVYMTELGAWGVHMWGCVGRDLDVVPCWWSLYMCVGFFL